LAIWSKETFIAMARDASKKGRLSTIILSVMAAMAVAVSLFAASADTTADRVLG